MMPGTLCLPQSEEAAPTHVISRVAMVVEYDGTNYCGFQFQGGSRLKTTPESNLAKNFFMQKTAEWGG